MNIFTFIKSHVTILEVVQEHTTLKKNGSYWKGCCPFHHEKTASFTVSPHKEIFYCFGCHITGDVISFIEKIEHCSSLEAAYYIAQRFNITIPDHLLAKHNDTNTTPQNRDLYFTLCKQLAEWSYHNLQKNHTLLRYLAQRGFTQTTIDQFMLGYFPGGISAIKLFLEHMRTHHILAKDLIDAHILTQGKTSLYSPFEERIIFPIKDHVGRLCGFGGRIFKQNDDRPKYYNSKENEFFAKGTLLFGLDTAKKAMQDTDSVFLVEGYTDCMAMVQNGFPNTVATLGTACTLHHLKTISRYVQQMYVLYDNDKAGQQAVTRLTQLCWQVDLELKVIQLPEGQDPASWLEHNNLQPLIDSAQDIFLFFIHTVNTNFSLKSIPEKVRIARTVIDIIRTIDDTLKQDFLLQKAAKLFDIPFQSLKQELSRPGKHAPSLEHHDNKTVEIPLVSELSSLPVTALETQLFCAILNNIPSLHNLTVNYVIGNIHPQLQTILNQLSTAYTLNPHITFNTFFCSLNNQEQQWIGKLMLEYENINNSTDIEKIASQLQKRFWKKIVRTLKQRIEQATHAGNKTEVEKLIQDFLCLKKQHIPHAP